MRLIGLTGGIGSGKSTVSDYLKKKGIYIIDADAISREITAVGGDAIPRIREEFGTEYFDSEGKLDRKKVASVVFKDMEKKRLFESIVTDAVINRSINEFGELRKSGLYDIVIYDAPLLFEKNLDRYCDEVWLVSCKLDVRLKRIMLRDGMSEKQILDRISNQMPEEEKIARADHVIDNSFGLEELYAQIDSLLE